jgi:predicted DNA-binding transcriptional regulator AlpA
MSASETSRRDHQRRQGKREEQERRRQGRQILRPKEAAKRLGISPSTFYDRFVRTGRLRLVALGPHSSGAIEDEIDDLIDQMIEERDAA